MQGTGTGVGRILGIIDLGSNSAHLMVVRIAPNGVFAVLNRVKHMLRLGENAFQERRLQEEAMQRAFHVLHSFGAMCASYGAQEVITVATSAVRDAHNAQEFIQRAYEATGLAVTVISGQEEARLIYLGVASGLPHSLGQRLFMDIGGGSTELAVGNSLDHVCLESLKLGCVRLDNQFLQGREKPVSEAEFAAMRNFVRMEASHSLQRVSAYDITELVGSSGTIQTLHALGHRLERGTAPGPDETTLTLDNLRRTSRHICSLPLSKRKELPGVSPRRAEVLVPGAAILQAMLEELHMESMQVSGRNILDGILVDQLRRLGYGPQPVPGGIREQSVQRLARRCNFEERHARHMMGLALQLYDSAAECGCISPDRQARELLSHAAILHDIGIFIAYPKHAQHSHYLIRNTELLGFTQDEIEFMAQLALLHGKGPSRKQEQASTEGLGRLAQHLRPCALFLSLAEGLDRTHCQNVHTAEFRRDGGEAVRLHIAGNGNCLVEQDALKGMDKVIKKGLGRDIPFSFVSRGAGTVQAG